MAGEAQFCLQRGCRGRRDGWHLVNLHGHVFEFEILAMGSELLVLAINGP
jgi:hypothetical protein